MKDDPLFHSAVAMVAADNYADWTFSLFRSWVRGDVLEVGCGVGTFTRRLVASQACRRILSIDISADAVAHCRDGIQHASLEIRHADVQAIDGAFDLILCLNVLEHIEDAAAALQHMVDLLRPGGTLFLLVPAHALLYSAFDRESGHYRRYSKAAMRALLAHIRSATPLSVRQFYFNTIGAIGYFAVYRLFRKPPRADASDEIGWYDRYVVPVQRRIEGNGSPFGISLVSVVTKGDVS